MTATPDFAVGSLVRARGREWVVLPESDPELLLLRPLGATDDEIAGILRGLESVEPAHFLPPDPDQAGDARSARLLRDALRLGFRSSAGPFRSFGRIAVEPRPYQLVPLLVGLKLDPVRLLIADDVGIGKTIEAALIARELLDRGEVNRLAVLCPPHLAEQWQAELREKFNIDAELVLTATVRRLERDLAAGESLFDVYPYVIVSTDFIKSDARRDDFLRACPELVIVDEAHTFAFGQRDRGRHQRHELLTGLSEDPDRHLILVTATPHSGKEDAFESLLGILDPKLAQLPEDLSGDRHEADRALLARHLVQRRRADIRAYLDAETPFPDRLSKDETYELSPDYKRLFDRAVEWARETIREHEGDRRRQRVQWWAALGLLRALGSSPAAAAATLRNRAAALAARSAKEADELGRRAVMDEAGDEDLESLDIAPGADAEEDGVAAGERRRRLELARAVEALAGAKDTKLQRAIALVKKLVGDGYSPIVFCRFIDTAEYLAENLRQALGKKTEVIAVTGRLAAAEREERVTELGEHPRRVLVATDCLSEGINLQQDFDAVVHYDLAWNPTRHEQREGRVDRFGQRRPEVRVVTYYGSNSPIDGIVLNVLLRKHQAIRKRLGISVPVPVDSGKVGDAILEGLITRGRGDDSLFEQLTLIEEVADEQKREFHDDWDSAAEREKRSMTKFAQRTIKTEEVAGELAAVREAVGSGTDAEAFAAGALRALGLGVEESETELAANVAEAPASLRDALGLSDSDATLTIKRGPDGGIRRAHPAVQALAAYTLDAALSSDPGAVASRCGVMRTHAVATLTTLLLVRLRARITETRRGREEREHLIEDAWLTAWRGSGGLAGRLDPEELEALLVAEPAANVSHDLAVRTLTRALVTLQERDQELIELGNRHAAQILGSHERVRAAARLPGRFEIEIQQPLDLLGVYVYLPVAAA